MTVPRVAFADNAGSARWTVTLITVLLLSAVLAVSAKIEIPFWPVPMTLETLAVLGIAGVAGMRLGLAAVLLWLFEGALGLPVLAGPLAGAAYFVGPTGGYLAGFLLAAVVVGLAADHGFRRKPLLLFVAMLAGVALIYAAGVLWLAQSVGWPHAFTVGVLPFVPADVTKAALAAALTVAVGRLPLRA